MATNFRNLQDGGFRLVPRSTDPTSPIEGDIQFADGTIRAKGIWEYKNGAWSQVASSSAGINYIVGGNAESGLSSFVTYADAAGALPVDGTGGSPNVTFAVSSSSPLRGLNSFLFTKDAANRQGQGASYAFTLDSADKNQVLNVSFDYEISSGTFASGDLTVYLYDVTNAQVIQPAGYTIQSLSSGITGRHLAQFQTTTSTSYRLIFHVASTSASAYTVKMENIVLGPQTIQYGAPITDWQNQGVISLTSSGTTPTKGSVLVDRYFTRRVGGNLEVRMEYQQSGTGTAGTGVYLFGLPGGLSIDTDRITTSTTLYRTMAVGVASFGRSSGPLTYGAQVVVYNSTKVAIRVPDAGSSNRFVEQGHLDLANADTTYSLDFSVPILGWSSSVQISNDTDTRVVAATYTSSSTTINNTTPTIIFTSKKFDTHSSYNTSTGEYTISVPGTYNFSGYIETNGVSWTAGDSIRVELYKNGSQYSRIGGVQQEVTISDGLRLSFGGLVDVISGDIITIRVFSSRSVNLSGANNSFSVNRLSGPSAIAASESIVCRYVTGAGQSIPNSTDIIVDFGTKSFDSHNAVTTGASWKFTAPISGKYLVESIIKFTSGGGWASGETAVIKIRKNGSSQKDTENTQQATHTNNVVIIATDTISLIAGDYIDVVARQNSGASLNLSADSLANTISIHRVGN